MKFHVHPDPIRRRIVVYCEIGEEQGKRLFVTRDTPERPAMVHHIGIGEEPPIWDWFPEEIVRELAEALSPRPAATERHLDDALAVRDRLLAMVERAERAAYPPQIITGPDA